MLTITSETLAALEADASRREFFAFAHWWRSVALPPMELDGLQRLWHFAGEQALELGIEDDEDGRVSLYAAAWALLGDMDGLQFLQVSDILFRDGTIDERVAAVRAVARQSPARF